MNKQLVRRLQSRYPVGTRIQLLQMEDPHPVPAGTYGTVLGVDDMGSLLVEWDNGQHLNVLYGIDQVNKV